MKLPPASVCLSLRPSNPFPFSSPLILLQLRAMNANVDELIRLTLPPQLEREGEGGGGGQGGNRLRRRGEEEEERRFFSEELVRDSTIIIVEIGRAFVLFRSTAVSRRAASDSRTWRTAKRKRRSSS